MVVNGMRQANIAAEGMMNVELNSGFDLSQLCNLGLNEYLQVSKDGSLEVFINLFYLLHLQPQQLETSYDEPESSYDDPDTSYGEREFHPDYTEFHPEGSSYPES